jgi:hypothetical protein
MAWKIQLVWLIRQQFWLIELNLFEPLLCPNFSMLHCIVLSSRRFWLSTPFIIISAVPLVATPCPLSSLFVFIFKFWGTRVVNLDLCWGMDSQQLTNSQQLINSQQFINTPSSVTALLSTQRHERHSIAMTTTNTATVLPWRQLTPPQYCHDDN